MQHAVLKNEVVVRSVGRSIVDISQQGIHTRQRCILTKCKHIMEYGDESLGLGTSYGCWKSTCATTMSGSAGSQCKPMPHQGGKEWVLDHHNSFFLCFSTLYISHCYKKVPKSVKHIFFLVVSNVWDDLVSYFLLLSCWFLFLGLFTKIYDYEFPWV